MGEGYLGSQTSKGTPVNVPIRIRTAKPVDSNHMHSSFRITGVGLDSRGTRSWLASTRHPGRHDPMNNIRAVFVTVNWCTTLDIEYVINVPVYGTS